MYKQLPHSKSKVFHPKVKLLNGDNVGLLSALLVPLLLGISFQRVGLFGQ